MVSIRDKKRYMTIVKGLVVVLGDIAVDCVDNF
jgi:hypothetical protein